MKFLTLILLSFNCYAINITEERVRLLPPSSPATGVFMTLTNASKQDRFLIKALSDRAKKVELHNHIMEGGMMKMREVEKIKIPAKGKVTLKPGGLHIMLIGLSKPLQEGEKIPLTLVFKDGLKKAIEPEVKKIKVQH